MAKAKAKIQNLNTSKVTSKVKLSIGDEQTDIAEVHLSFTLGSTLDEEPALFERNAAQHRASRRDGRGGPGGGETARPAGGSGDSAQDGRAGREGVARDFAPSSGILW